MIGIPLVEMLVERGAKVRVASLDSSLLCPEDAYFIKADLRNLTKCQDVVYGMDYVFHLAGVKGSPEMTTKKPASFFTTIVLANTSMMEAARWAGVEKYLYASTVGVYAPAEVLHEDDVWKSFPSGNDRFAGWAKRMGELQAEAYRIEYGWEGISIVRPANCYGSQDNFGLGAMVIPSLIKRAVDGENPLVIWGDGSQVRDFIHARDVARGMLLVMEQGIQEPVNLGSGKGISIKELVDIIVSNLEDKPEIIWDTAKPSGDKKRVMDISRALSIGFSPTITLEQGIKETMDWYRKNRNVIDKRYNVFE